jgi:hypothetical protein
VLVGVQLSVRNGAAQGKMPDKLVACVDRLPSDSFVPFCHSLLQQNLSADEIATEKFFLGDDTEQRIGIVAKREQYYRGQNMRITLEYS